MIIIEIAAIAVALEVDDAAMREKVREHYSAFLAPHARPQLSVRVKVTPNAQFIAPRPGPWAIETALQGEELSFRSYFDAGWADLARGTGQLELAPHATVENYLRVLYAHLALRAGGLLLHAAGVVRDGQGYGFYGPSGSGKSTSSQLSLDAGYTVLSDDLIIVRQQHAETRVYGVPFRGTLITLPRTKLDAPLRGLFELRKASAHAVHPTPRPLAVASLARCVPFVMNIPAQGAQVVARCAALARAVPVAALHFRKDDGYWSQIDAYLRALSTPA